MGEENLEFKDTGNCLKKKSEGHWFYGRGPQNHGKVPGSFDPLRAELITGFVGTTVWMIISCEEIASLRSHLPTS